MIEKIKPCLEKGDDSFIEIISLPNNRHKLYKYYWNHLLKEDIALYHCLQNQCIKVFSEKIRPINVNSILVDKITIEALKLPSQDLILETESIINDQHEILYDKLGRKTRKIELREKCWVTNPNFINGSSLSDVKKKYFQGLNSQVQSIISDLTSKFENYINQNLGVENAAIITKNNVMLVIEDGTLKLIVTDIGGNIHFLLDQYRNNQKIKRSNRIIIQIKNIFTR